MGRMIVVGCIIASFLGLSRFFGLGASQAAAVEGARTRLEIPMVPCPFGHVAHMKGDGPFHVECDGHKCWRGPNERTAFEAADAWNWGLGQ